MTASDAAREPTVLVHRGLPFRETDERTLELDVFRPRDAVDDADRDSSEPDSDVRTDAGRPIVVFVYGGGWSEGATGQFARYALAFAAAGWVAVECSYRLADEARFPAPIVDVHAALDWLGEHAVEYGGDPDRVAVAGHSAGAHLAALASLTRDHPELTPSTADRPTGSVRSSVAAVTGVSGVYDFDHPSIRDEFPDLLGDRNDDRTLEAQRRLASPVSHVPAGNGDDSVPPTLLLHGADDEVVPPEQSERYRDALESAGATVECDIVPDADHVFLHSSSEYPSTRAEIAAFFDEYV